MNLGLLSFKENVTEYLFFFIDHKISCFVFYSSPQLLYRIGKMYQVRVLNSAHREQYKMQRRDIFFFFVYRGKTRYKCVKEPAGILLELFFSLRNNRNSNHQYGKYRFCHGVY